MNRGQYVNTSLLKVCKGTSACKGLIQRSAASPGSLFNELINTVYYVQLNHHIAFWDLFRAFKKGVMYYKSQLS